MYQAMVEMFKRLRLFSLYLSYFLLPFLKTIGANDFFHPSHILRKTKCLAKYLSVINKIIDLIQPGYLNWSLVGYWEPLLIHIIHTNIRNFLHVSKLFCRSQWKQDSVGILLLV